MTNRKLLEEIALGDTFALQQLIEHYGGFVAAVVRSGAGGAISGEDRDEIVSDVFVSLWKNAQKLDPDASLKPWLAVVARNATINRMRGSRFTSDIEETMLPDPSINIETSALQTEASAVVAEAMQTLSSQDRTIFDRYYFWHETIPSISRRLGINESTIKSRLSRGREKLKAELARKGYSL
jgi:RNA polymerase sigma-70 factor (ECF subfamily)